MNGGLHGGLHGRLHGRLHGGLHGGLIAPFDWLIVFSLSTLSDPFNDRLPILDVFEYGLHWPLQVIFCLCLCKVIPASLPVLEQAEPWPFHVGAETLVIWRGCCLNGRDLELSTPTERY